MHQGKYTTAAKEYAAMALITDQSPSGDGWVPSFEQKFSEFSGMQYAISVNSATSGLHAALMAVGVGPGDEVISPGLTVVMDAYATLFCGAVPVFADVDLNTWNLNPESVEKLITSKTRAILTVSWFGLPSELGQLREIANRHGLALIDDSAETMISRNLQEEEWQLPDIRVFSFESKKHFTTGGEGGMVTTNSPELAEKVRKLAGIGYRHLGPSKGRTHLAARDFQTPGYLRFDTVGYNYRMTPVSAAIGLGQLEGVEEFLNARKRCAQALAKAIDGYSFFVPQLPETFHSYYSFGFRLVEEKANGWGWQEIYDRITELGGDGFYSNCANPYLEPSLEATNPGWQKFEPGLCPVAEHLQKTVLAFKTNYLDFKLLEKNAMILNQVCKEIAGE